MKFRKKYAFKKTEFVSLRMAKRFIGIRFVRFAAAAVVATQSVKRISAIRQAQGDRREKALALASAVMDGHKAIQESFNLFRPA